ncbi:MAG: hypothetical protein Q9181_001884 [Wetmoreana brouardii]
MGLAAAGSATGGVVLPAMIQQLLPKIGFAWTIRAIGFLMLGLAVLANCSMRTRIPPRKVGPIVEWTAFREIPYVLFSIGMSLDFFSLYFVFYYIGAFGKDIIGVSQSDSINLLLIINGIGLFGRIFPNYVSDAHIGPLNTLIILSSLTSLLLLTWIAVRNQGGLTAFAVPYGFFAAGIPSIHPSPTRPNPPLSPSNPSQSPNHTTES